MQVIQTWVNFLTKKENKTGIINHHLPASSMMMPIKNDQLPQWLIGNDSNVTVEKPRKMTFFCTVSSTSNWWPAHSNAHYFWSSSSWIEQPQTYVGDWDSGLLYVAQAGIRTNDPTVSTGQVQTQAYVITPGRTVGTNRDAISILLICSRPFLIGCCTWLPSLFP